MQHRKGNYMKKFSNEIRRAIHHRQAAIEPSMTRLSPDARAAASYEAPELICAALYAPPPAAAPRRPDARAMPCKQSALLRIRPTRNAIARLLDEYLAARIYAPDRIRARPWAGSAAPHGSAPEEQRCHAPSLEAGPSPCRTQALVAATGRSPKPACGFGRQSAREEPRHGCRGRTYLPLRPSPIFLASCERAAA